MEEKILKTKKNGMLVLILDLLILLGATAGMITGGILSETSESPLAWVLFGVSLAVLMIGWIPLCGLRVLKPQEALVLTLFGKYIGTLKGEVSNFVTPQNVSTDICTKLYSTSTEKLFYLAISAINANNFHIDEIQSKTGYILFTAVNRQFLATIVKFSSSKAMLKITPVSNVYYFQPGIVLNMFKYIDLNVQDTPIVNVSVLR